MRASDQTSPNAALIALRDKYRTRAIRTWDRFQARFQTEPKVNMLGFQTHRDYMIYAAESVGAITGFASGDTTVSRPDEGIGNSPVADSDVRVVCRPLAKSSDVITTPVATEESK